MRDQRLIYYKRDDTYESFLRYHFIHLDSGNFIVQNEAVPTQGLGFLFKLFLKGFKNSIHARAQRLIYYKRDDTYESFLRYHFIHLDSGNFIVQNEAVPTQGLGFLFELFLKGFKDPIK